MNNQPTRPTDMLDVTITTTASVECNNYTNKYETINNYYPLTGIFQAGSGKRRWFVATSKCHLQGDDDDGNGGDF